MELYEICLIIIALALLPLALKNVMSAVDLVAPALPWIAGVAGFSLFIYWATPDEPHGRPIGSLIGIAYSLFIALLFQVIRDELGVGGWSWSLLGWVFLAVVAWALVAWWSTFFWVFDSGVLLVILAMGPALFLVIPAAWIHLKWHEWRSAD